MLDAFGLRGEYEGLFFESANDRAMLEQVLAARDRVPNRSPPAGPTAAAPEEWHRGKFCFLADRDIPKLREAMDALAQLENTVAMRLQDEGATVTFRITGAARRMAEERCPAIGGPTWRPRRVLLESPWLRFMDIGEVGFRVLPHGDANAGKGYATIFVWMRKPPPVSFTFCVHVGATGTGGATSTAPRVWCGDVSHYRLTISWTQIEAVFSAMEERDEQDLDVALVVVQWHGAVPTKASTFLPNSHGYLR